jgi:hypothetical protein
MRYRQKIILFSLGAGLVGLSFALTGWHRRLSRLPFPIEHPHSTGRNRGSSHPWSLIDR